MSVRLPVSMLFAVALVALLSLATSAPASADPVRGTGTISETGYVLEGNGLEPIMQFYEPDAAGHASQLYLLSDSPEILGKGYEVGADQNLPGVCTDPQTAFVEVCGLINTPTFTLTGTDGPDKLGPQCIDHAPGGSADVHGLGAPCAPIFYVKEGAGDDSFEAIYHDSRTSMDIDCGEGDDTVVNLLANDLVHHNCEHVPDGAHFVEDPVPPPAPPVVPPVGPKIPASLKPVATCDRFWIRPDEVLKVPAPGFLANDFDPAGQALTAHLDLIDFGVASHPYSFDEKSGALTFTAGSAKSSKPFQAQFTYHVTNSAGTSSAKTQIVVYVQPEPPSPATLGACRGDAALQSRSGRPTPIYVALGDSYSSGEGACTPNTEKNCAYLSGTDVKGNHCHRSPNAYGPLIYEYLKPYWQFRFGACSGALVKDIAHPNGTNDEKPQLSLLKAEPGTEVRLVTLTVGGNDQKFSTIVKHCVMEHMVDTGLFVTYPIPTADRLLKWVGLKTLRSLWSPCYKAHGLSTPVDMQKNLETVYGQILKLAPKARLVVLGYPSLFDRVAPKINGFNCDVNASDARHMAEGEEEFNRLIGRAVGRVSATYGNRIAYIDNTYTFDHHELCRRNLFHNNQPSWINAHVFLGKPASFHPNILGHRVLRDTAMLDFNLSSMLLGG